VKFQMEEDFICCKQEVLDSLKHVLHDNHLSLNENLSL
jgi:hypothetical protein